MCIKRVNGGYFATICRLCYTILAGNFCKGSFFTARFLRSIWQLYPRTNYVSTQVISVDSPRISCFSRNSPPHFQEVTLFRLTLKLNAVHRINSDDTIYDSCVPSWKYIQRNLNQLKTIVNAFLGKRNYLRRTLDS